MLAQYYGLRVLLGNATPLVASEWGYSTCRHPCEPKDLHATTERLQVLRPPPPSATSVFTIVINIIVIVIISIIIIVIISIIIIPFHVHPISSSPHQHRPLTPPGRRAGSVPRAQLARERAGRGGAGRLLVCTRAVY